MYYLVGYIFTQILSAFKEDKINQFVKRHWKRLGKSHRGGVMWMGAWWDVICHVWRDVIALCMWKPSAWIVFDRRRMGCKTFALLVTPTMFDNVRFFDVLHTFIIMLDVKITGMNYIVAHIFLWIIQSNLLVLNVLSALSIFQQLKFQTFQILPTILLRSFHS